MKKKGTRFFSPKSISELKDLIVNEPDVTLLAGGTSLFRDLNGDTLEIPGAIILLENIPELKRENRTERYFEFGSMLTIQQIIDSSKKNITPVLLKALEKNAPFPIRNMATIGGSISNKKIKSDLIPLLILFNCKVEVINLKDKKIKTKWEPISQYLSSLNKRDLHLITRIRIPLINPAYYQYYKTGHKYNLFNEITFSAIADIEKGSVSSLSMAFNIKNSLIVRTRDIDAELIGKHVPISFKTREYLTQTIESSLEQKKKLTAYQRYSMTQIILHFLEAL